MYQMAKAYYDVTYKTYYNDRIKPVPFRGKESHPLYVQVTFDRRTIFFKSYYFELFRQKKYDSQPPTPAQIEKFEGRVIDYIIARNTDRFSLDLLQYEYKLYSADVLDTFEKPFLEWLAGFLRAERLPGLAAMIAQGTEEFLAIQLCDDLKAGLQPDLVSRIEEKAIRETEPYYLLAAFVRYMYPKGPFCLPCHEWKLEDENHFPVTDAAAEKFFDDTLWRENIRVDILDLIRKVHRMMFKNIRQY
jgi:hypothetical protein